jgi:hypothetical protein
MKCNEDKQIDELVEVNLEGSIGHEIYRTVTNFTNPAEGNVGWGVHEPQHAKNHSGSMAILHQAMLRRNYSTGSVDPRRIKYFQDNGEWHSSVSSTRNGLKKAYNTKV